MKQIKIKRKKGRFVIEIRTDPSQTVSQRDVETMQSDPGSGFLPLTVEAGRSAHVLRYEASGLLPIAEFLQMTVLSKQMFLCILRQYVRFEKQLERHYCNKDAVLYDERYILIDPASWHVYFTYVPIQPFEGQGSLRLSLQELIRYANFDPNEDLEYVREYISLVGSDIGFSIFRLREYLRRNEEKKEKAAPEKRCLGCGFPMKESDAFCPMCGRAVKNSTAGKASDGLQYVPAEDGIIEKENGTGPEQLSINEDETGTVTVFGAKTSGERSALLKNDRDSIRMGHFPFRIGKQADIVDHQIRNKTVSRKHADIVSEQGRYFVLDLDSTNGTFLNGRKLLSGVREELHPGDTVTFANEAYSFIITEG